MCSVRSSHDLRSQALVLPAALQEYGMAKKKKAAAALDVDIQTADYRHEDEKRTNIPLAKIAAEGTIPAVPRAKYAFSPHLQPTLRFDATATSDALVKLIDAARRRVLTPDEHKILLAAVQQHAPWMEWAGRREQHAKGHFDVDPVALHIHERVSARAILRVAERKDIQRSLFADPELPYQQEVRFYQHHVDWANRLILGDCLTVMSSLARREGLAGKVQMVYMDPPYGISYSSNFQAKVHSREGKDGDDASLTREPEQIAAYRDTWTLGIHSYLSYLRDRLILCKELLADSGSVFVQINAENVHRVRLLLDEIFGADNCCAQIMFSKTSGASSPMAYVNVLATTTDYVLWYAKDRAQVKYRQLYLRKEPGGQGGSAYTRVEMPTGERRGLADDVDRDVSGTRIYSLDNLTSQGWSEKLTVDFEFRGRKYHPGTTRHWKTTVSGLHNLVGAGRVEAIGNTLRYVRFLNDFAVYPITNNWGDTGVAGYADVDRKVYTVQTASKVIARCILMSTDPGDLVLDPTCGSGTTAYMAEQWGRRWITMDTSRVAITIARQRLLTAKFDHFRVRGSDNGSQVANPAKGFDSATVPHITLKSIAQSPNLQHVFEKHDALLNKALDACNRALKSVTPALRRELAAKLVAKQRDEGKRSISEADTRRWDLSATNFEHWTVPFDTDPLWPKELRSAVEAYRGAGHARSEEVDACISANAEHEDLVDEPHRVKGVVRVSGPFTVEGVRPGELSLGDEGGFAGGPPAEDGGSGALSTEAQNITAYLSRMVELLRKDGLTFINNRRLQFTRVEPTFQAGMGGHVHAEAIFSSESDGSGPCTVGVGFGPQYGPVTAQQVEELVRAASRRYDDLVIAGFSFDAAASAAIQEAKHPKLRIHQAYIRPDVNPAMNGLLKDSPGNQLFTVFGQPEIKVEQKSGEFVCVLSGVDIYDPVQNTVRSAGAESIAAWFLDSDYDGRCFCTTQAFFPNQQAWDKIAKALGGSPDAEPFASFKSTRSIPFRAGKHRRIAVKVIDPRGNEVMAVKALES
jgi:adenine-specific DNA-methyltransferase